MGERLENKYVTLPRELATGSLAAYHEAASAPNASARTPATHDGQGAGTAGSKGSPSAYPGSGGRLPPTAC
jgi:hypothetical protein